MIELIIPEPVPSNNAVMRMHHRERTKQHNRWFWLVHEAASRLPAHILLGPPLLKCKIEVARYSSRMLDFDNMGGGCKFLMDALVKNRIIEDDNPKCVTQLVLQQHKSKKKDACTVVIIT